MSYLIEIRKNEIWKNSSIEPTWSARIKLRELCISLCIMYIVNIRGSSLKNFLVPCQDRFRLLTFGLPICQFWSICVFNNNNKKTLYYRVLNFISLIFYSSLFMVWTLVYLNSSKRYYKSTSSHVQWKMLQQ